MLIGRHKVTPALRLELVPKAAVRVLRVAAIARTLPMRPRPFVMVAIATGSMASLLILCGVGSCAAVDETALSSAKHVSATAIPHATRRTSVVSRQSDEAQIHSTYLPPASGKPTCRGPPFSPIANDVFR